MPMARMLIATPETIWSTAKVTVATAWSRPPMAPKTMAANRPAHGPHWYPAQPAPNVPRTSMPSRPMLTTPARSDHRPPRPAMPIGTARPKAAATVPGDVRLVTPVMRRTTDSSNSSAVARYRMRMPVSRRDD